MQQNPTDILKEYWGFSYFKGSQKRIINAVLQKNDVLALLPTGGGKSLCYQIPALVNEGICIVVSPLVALIQNQVDSLRQKGIKAIALTGGISFEEVHMLLDNCLHGNYKFLYLSPERLMQETILDRIRQMQVNLIAIDEAHCISQWGNDFRPAYLQCAKLREVVGKVPLLALTATATQRVSLDILQNLEMESALIVKDSFLRTNIAFKIFWEEDKLYKLQQLWSTTNNSGIVYVRTRRLAQELSRFLNAKGCSASFFHGGLTKNEKKERLDRWLKNNIQIMVATNAFGMGVDKPDVKLVVHYQIPDSIENYFQEAGRAGRDGKAAEAVLITNKEDEKHLKKQFLSVLPDIAFIKTMYRKLTAYFQIAFGEGSGESHALKFNEFCAQYNFNSLLAFNTLKILDQHSVISLSENFNTKTTVRFTASKDQIFRYLDIHKTEAPVIKTILRTYGGIFENAIKVNTYLLAKKAATSEAHIINVLERLQADEIIDYKANHSDLEITFLVPREDNRTIHRFSNKVKELQRLKTNNIEHILAYIKNDTVCRNKQLLGYFGEQLGTDCGFCDVCEGRRTSDYGDMTLIEDSILGLLGRTMYTSRALIRALPYKEDTVLKAIQHLLENEKIEIHTKNQYRLL